MWSRRWTSFGRPASPWWTKRPGPGHAGPRSPSFTPRASGACWWSWFRSPLREIRGVIDFTIPDDLAAIRSRVAEFVENRVLPVEPSVDGSNFDEGLASLREAAREAGLWNPHLPPEWGGLGLGPLGMALVSQELGVSGLASLALNCMAPDEGNMHLLLHAASDEQKERYLRPLAEGAVRSCFAMTERDVGSSDPPQLRTSATRDGDGWVLNGEKWFISGAAGAAFAIVVARTEEDPEVDPRNRFTLFLVDAGNPG